MNTNETPKRSRLGLWRILADIAIGYAIGTTIIFALKAIFGS